MECYRRYAPALLRKGQRLLGNASDAEDVVPNMVYALLVGIDAYPNAAHRLAGCRNDARCHRGVD